MIRPFEELVFRQHRAAGIRSTYEQRSFDAFFAMLAFFQQMNAAAGAGPETGTEADVSQPDPDTGDGHGIDGITRWCDRCRHGGGRRRPEGRSEAI